MEPHAILKQIRRRHIAGWSKPRLDALALTVCGVSDGDAARILGVSERSIRRRLTECRELIVDGLETAPSREIAVTWFWCHADCCMRGPVETLESIEKLQVCPKLATFCLLSALPVARAFG